uniref:GlxA family transcriptional regulator n=1 Tax=Pararhizobium sp. IMCC3301 TaxID=3067904 RepID=UPI002740E1AB|nr:GlxA family transcriptional regulator [Pararhizobium sp. IMCC3301]
MVLCELVRGNESLRRFVFLALPNFSMIAFATAIEPLRLANRFLTDDFYSWSVVSANGNPVCASNGLEIAVDGSLDTIAELSNMDDRPDMVLVCAGIDVDQLETKHTRALIRRLYRTGIAIGGLCTASWVLAEAGLLDDRQCAIHWENLPGFMERFPKAHVHADLFEVDGRLYTCAGGTAALDMMLYIIAQDHEESIINRICEQCLTDRVRSATDRQRLPLRARLGVQNARLLSIIEMMEANISEPLALTDIAATSNLSRRQIERLFRHNLARSPARYYSELRLDRARHLLLQSNLPIVDVAIASGFVSASHFSKCYRDQFGRSPQVERREKERAQRAATAGLAPGFVNEESLSAPV